MTLLVVFGIAFLVWCILIVESVLSGRKHRRHMDQKFREIKKTSQATDDILDRLESKRQHGKHRRNVIQIGTWETWVLHDFDKGL